MTQELLTIQVGECGLRLGSRFWESMVGEHGIGLDGRVCFEDNLEGTTWSMMGNIAGATYRVNTVLVDLERSALDQVRRNDGAQLYRPDRMVSGQSGAGNNYAKGFYTEGAELVDEVLDTIRREVEGYRSFQGFNMVHSIGGGTGSGLGSLIMSRLKEEYPDRMVMTYTVFPSEKVSDVVVEPYNVIASLKHLKDEADLTISISNEALYNIANQTFQLRSPTYDDLNKIGRLAISEVTAPFRFGSSLNNNVSRLAANLVTRRDLHFPTFAFAPIGSDQSGTAHTVEGISESLFSPGNSFVADPTTGVYLNGFALFRGDFSPNEVAEHDLKGMSAAVEWIPDNVKHQVFDRTPSDYRQVASFIGNSTSVKELFSFTLGRFQRLWRRRAFLHWYTGEGMEDVELEEAEQALQDLLTQYQDLEGAEPAEEGEWDGGDGGNKGGIDDPYGEDPYDEDPMMEDEECYD